MRHLGPRSSRTMTLSAKTTKRSCYRSWRRRFLNYILAPPSSFLASPGRVPPLPLPPKWTRRCYRRLLRRRSVAAGNAPLGRCGRPSGTRRRSDGLSGGGGRCRPSRGAGRCRRGRGVDCPRVGCGGGVGRQRKGRSGCSEAGTPWTGVVTYAVREVLMTGGAQPSVRPMGERLRGTTQPAL